MDNIYLEQLRQQQTIQYVKETSSIIINFNAIIQGPDK